MNAAFSLKNESGRKLPSLPWRRVKNAILGMRYRLSLAAVTRRESARLNRRYRGEIRAASVLAFPLEKHGGEIILCPDAAAQKAVVCGRSPRERLAFLFIHGCLHLKGLRHGSKMEREEARFMEKFVGTPRRSPFTR